MSYAEDSTVLVTHAHVEHGTAANKTEVEPPLPVDYYRYTVKHVEIFKAPMEYNGTLSTAVYTPVDSSACGVQLEVGKDYLLSGAVNNGKLMTNICNQLREPSYTGVTMEWSAVSDDLKKKLQNKELSSCD
ncbi:unnamed protein product [Enterobius vermicularis]|uniref:NTR domain-containing protein n=1 Tax=Enterobius vermicularis TaxID=51028 RepID=A0A0N4UWT6_ENTVE|nr:unnamed protein product [Enterobius vermicularis]